MLTRLPHQLVTPFLLKLQPSTSDRHAKKNYRGARVRPIERNSNGGRPAAGRPGLLCAVLSSLPDEAGRVGSSGLKLHDRLSAMT